MKDDPEFDGLEKMRKMGIGSMRPSALARRVATRGPKEQVARPIGAMGPNDDYTGFRWEAVPSTMRKADKGHPLVPADATMKLGQCVICHHRMWTRDPKLEDTCSDCEYAAHSDTWDMRKAQAQARRKVTGGVDPFSDVPPAFHGFWPK
jgi:hypothetical protein